VFATCEDILQWALTVDIGFVAVIMIMRSNTSPKKRGRTSFVLIDCERNRKYRTYKKDLVRTVTDSRKCGIL